MAEEVEVREVNKFAACIIATIFALAGVTAMEMHRGSIELSNVYYWVLFISAYNFFKD